MDPACDSMTNDEQNNCTQLCNTAVTKQGENKIRITKGHVNINKKTTDREVKMTQRVSWHLRDIDIVMIYN